MSWHDYDRVVVRWPWDYTHKRDEFVEWAESVGDRLHNRPAVLRWNSEKSYLADLQAAGLPVVDTTPGAARRPRPRPAWRGGGQAHRVGGRARHRVASARPCITRPHALIERLTGAGRTAMVQPYLAAVEARGETAIVMFAGRRATCCESEPCWPRTRRRRSPTTSWARRR